MSIKSGDFLGELIGTFVLVFLGCSTVAIAVLYGIFDLWEVAFLWGIAVFAGVLIARRLSSAHLNPAVSLCALFSGVLSLKKFLRYLFGQSIGAFLAGFVVYLCFSSSIMQYELAHNITRGTFESNQTAMIFGEFFPNPGFPEVKVSMYGAALVEFSGTLALLLSISFASKYVRNEYLKLMVVSATVSMLIYFGSPYTQVGINPARDLFPRLVAVLAGWDSAAFPEPFSGFFFVYMLAPSVAGLLVGLANKRFTH
ncbi:MAG: MIP/aquaporin family protein [Cyclobacteriaceae bacterium]